LAVTFTQGAPPTLTLKRDDGTEDVEHIGTWTAHEVDAFLQSHLR